MSKDSNLRSIIETSNSNYRAILDTDLVSQIDSKIKAVFLKPPVQRKTSQRCSTNTHTLNVNIVFLLRQ